MHDYDVYEALFLNCKIHGSWIRGSGQYGHTCMYIILTILSSLFREQMVDQLNALLLCPQCILLKF